jgi:uncharacterized Zn finger protein (UPF0148 family)
LPEEVSVSDDEVILSMTIPVDSDGFLRRECPTCEREFKWLATPPDQAEDTESPQHGGYYCPYCGVQAETGSWLTKAQAELAQNVAMREVVDPMLKKLGDDLKKMSSRSGGLVSVEWKQPSTPEIAPLTEADDMVRVDFSCHPTEPVKIMETWSEKPYCLICGVQYA